MRRFLRATAGAIVVVPMLTSAVSSAQPSAHVAGGTRSGQAPRVYLLAGANQFFGSVYAWRLGSATTRRVTSSPVEFNWISGSPRGIALGGASAGQEMYVYRRGTLREVKAAGHALRGVTPSLSSTGSFGYTASKYANRHASQPTAFDIVTRPAAFRGRTTTIFIGHSRPPGYHAFVIGPSWNPDGTRVAITKTTDNGGPTTVVIANASGNVIRRLNAPVNSGGPIEWSPVNAWAAAVSTARAHKAVFINTRTSRTREILAGWRPMCWSPNGSRVLAASGTRLGLISLAHPRRVQTIQTPSFASFFGCYWPPAPK